MRRLPGRGVGFVAVNDVELGDVCTFGSGGTPPRSTPEYFQGETPWITGADIGERSLISPRSFTTQEAISRSAVTVVPQGTALLVTRTSVGKVALSDRSLAFSQDITSISPDSSMLDPAYLVAFLASYAPKLAREARGATIQGVTRSDVARISIPLPPLPEQRRIASILEQADNLRAKRQRSIAIVDELIDATFHSTFDVSLSVNSSISSVLAEMPGAIRTGPFGSQLLHSEFTKSGIAVLGIVSAVQNEFSGQTPRFISTEKFDQLRRYQVHPGDVLITIMRTISRCAIVPDDIGIAVNTKHLCCITLEKLKCRPIYLQQYFLRDQRAKQYLASVSKGAIMDGLNMGLIRDMPIFLPHLFDQSTFERAFLELSKSKQRLQSHLDKLDELFASLQHRAFRGEL